MNLCATKYGWYGRHLLFVVLTMCALLVLVIGCSMFGKKEASDYEKAYEWIQEMRSRISNSVEDSYKKTEMLVIVAQVGKDTLELASITRKLYADFIKLNDSYNATPEDYQKLISEFEADYKLVRERVIESRFKLKDLTTPQEWDDLTDPGDNNDVFRMTIMPSPDMKGGTS